MRLPPLKIGDNYQLRNDMLEMMANFISRAPRMQETDIRARVTGADRARVRIQELTRDKGKEFLHGLFRTMLTRAEEAARKRIRGWNDGIYRVLLFQDTAGIGETLLRMYFTLYKEGDCLLFDLSGTSPEHDAGSHHSFAHHLPSLAAVCFFHYIFHDLPASSGCFAPMEWRVPQGCVLNAGDDAPVSNSPSLGCGPVAAIHQLFAKVIFDSPERSIIGGGIGGASGSHISGVNQYGVPISDMLSYAMNSEGQGARIDKDGMHAHGFVYTPLGRCPNAEDGETNIPVLHLFQRLRRDSCGFGKYRGGAGTTSVYVIHHVPQMSYTSTGRDTRLRMAQGIFGGYPSGTKFGIESRNTDLWHKMLRGDKDLPKDEEELMVARPIKGDYIFEHNTRPPRIVNNGDIFIMMSGGGVGYGDVLERDPEMVIDDLKKGIISRWTTDNVYHVAYDPETLEVDHEKTEELRRRERERRKEQGQRYEEFEREWSQKRPPEAALKHYGSWPDAKKVREIIRG